VRHYFNFFGFCSQEKQRATHHKRHLCSGYYATNTEMSIQYASRSLTYLNVNDDAYINTLDSTADAVFLAAYSLLSICFGLIAYFTIKVNRSVQEFQDWKAIHVVMPFISLFMMLECATLAFDEAVAHVSVYWAGVVYSLEAVVAPGLLLSTFVVTFLAYRIRAMPFCCVRRRPHGDDPMEVSSKAEPLVQPAVLVVGMNVFAIVLAVLSIVVNFDVMWSHSDMAGRTGWMTVFTEEWEPAMVHVFLALIPMTLVSCICFYFAVLLFRYGNELSITMYSSCCNPWIWPPIGCVSLFAAQFPSHWFPLWSNLGICIYQVAMLRILFEIRQELGEETDLGIYLGACWEVPAQFGETTEEQFSESIPSKDRTGILRRSTSSKGKEPQTNETKVPDSTLL
jgi:hypothetical protein